MVLSTILRTMSLFGWSQGTGDVPKKTFCQKPFRVKRHMVKSAGFQVGQALCFHRWVEFVERDVLHVIRDVHLHWQLSDVPVSPHDLPIEKIHRE